MSQKKLTDGKKAIELQAIVKEGASTEKQLNATIIIEPKSLQTLVDLLVATKPHKAPKTIEEALCDCASFAARVKGARKYTMLTMAKLAAKSGVSIASIKRYETLPINPKKEQLEKLAKALGCDPLWLLFG